MKIIDLLNKIANGEEVPKKIKINKIIFEYQGDDYLYKDEDKKEYWLFSAGYTDKFEWLDSALNTEVEIIEEEKKIPEKLDYCEENTFMEQKEATYLSPKERRLLDSNFKELGNKINSIIDYLKSKGE